MRSEISDIPSQNDDETENSWKLFVGEENNSVLDERGEKETARLKLEADGVVILSSVEWKAADSSKLCQDTHTHTQNIVKLVGFLHDTRGIDTGLP